VAASVLKNMGVPPDKISIGCNVGAIDFYYNRVRALRLAPGFAEMQARWQQPLFLYVGSLIPRKGLDHFLEALRILRPSQVWSAAIVGAGPEETALRAFCARHGLGRVAFVPFQQREGLARYFACADVFVLPSLRESGAIVLSEALASGLYTVASKNDGVAPDLIRPGRNGTIFDPCDHKVFAHALNEAACFVRNRIYNRERIAEEFMESKPITVYAQAIIDAATLAFHRRLL